MAQSGRAQRSGRWGRWFKSSRPDHLLFCFIRELKGVRHNTNSLTTPSPHIPVAPKKVEHDIPTPKSRDRTKAVAGRRKSNIFKVNLKITFLASKKPIPFMLYYQVVLSPFTFFIKKLSFLSIFGCKEEVYHRNGSSWKGK